MSDVNSTKNKIIMAVLKKMWSNKKIRCTILILLGVAIITGGVLLGVSYAKGAKVVNEMEKRIHELPDEVYNIAEYEEEICSIYTDYLALPAKQQKDVENSQKLLNLYTEYFSQKVNGLRALASQIKKETVADSTILSDFVLVYQSFTEEQKRQFNASERAQFDQYVLVEKIVSDLYSVQKDIIDKYASIPQIKADYSNVADEYKSLVYNYDLVDTFEDQYVFYKKFIFNALSDGGYEIGVAKDVSLEGVLVLPEYYRGEEIVKINSSAFVDQRKITAVTIPETVKTIERGAFGGCNRIEEMTLPFTGGDINSTEPFSYIFGDKGVPQSLKKVKITAKDRLENNVFSGCDYMESVVYEQPLEYIGASSFEGCENLLSFNSEEEGTLNLEGEMDAIGDYAFKNCKSIKKIVFSEEILTIGNGAFGFCRNIENLTLTNRMITIGDYAFEGLKNITQVTVFDSTKTIGIGAFKGCNSLVEMTLPFTGRTQDSGAYDAVFGFIFGYTELQATTQHGVKGTAFDNRTTGNIDGAVWQYSCCNGGRYNWGDERLLKSYYYNIPFSLEKVTITNQTEVKTAAFNGCTMLTDIIFTQGIESQGEYAFQNCTATLHDGTEN